MSWHEAMPVEVRAEFARLSGQYSWQRTEEAFWQATRVDGFNRWTSHASWWRRTLAGRRYQRAYQRGRTARLKAIVVAIRGCAACGQAFALTAYRRERGRGLVCSAKCRAALRRNIRSVRIGGDSMSLARWCDKFGVVDLNTAWARIRRGWDAKRAVETPPRGSRRAMNDNDTPLAPKEVAPTRP